MITLLNGGPLLAPSSALSPFSVADADAEEGASRQNSSGRTPTKHSDTYYTKQKIAADLKGRLWFDGTYIRSPEANTITVYVHVRQGKLWTFSWIVSLCLYIVMLLLRWDNGHNVHLSCYYVFPGIRRGHLTIHVCRFESKAQRGPVRNYRTRPVYYSPTGV